MVERSGVKVTRISVICAALIVAALLMTGGAIAADKGHESTDGVVAHTYCPADDVQWDVRKCGDTGSTGRQQADVHRPREPETPANPTGGVDAASARR